MFDFTKNRNGLTIEIIKEMETGYQEMGLLNVSLSEEGLEKDRRDLEGYEIYLVESE
ncbi:MAG: hypothetical protein PHV71_00480 [Eubacteriales bacterium]|nr:hypothetical protein [Eubacteriales bacterium]MDD3198692.1 hypothetical protein [Eubacteriales bacterium]MDD4121700.1 hypothetical protein [Eubacteriales bacterium]MDD4629062.1 hypothetical protein [Eubacteriales bacterium]